MITHVHIYKIQTKLRTDEASWSLLYNLHAEGAWHVGFVTITFDGNMFSTIKAFVGATTVVTLAILV